MRMNAPKVISQNVSLRGALADEYARLSMQKGITPTTLKAFVLGFAMSDNPEIIKFHEGDRLVIGRKEDKGQSLPDW